MFAGILSCLSNSLLIISIVKLLIIFEVLILLEINMGFHTKLPVIAYNVKFKYKTETCERLTMRDFSCAARIKTD